MSQLFLEGKVHDPESAALGDDITTAGDLAYDMVVARAGEGAVMFTRFELIRQLQSNLDLSLIDAGKSVNYMERTHRDELRGFGYRTSAATV